MNLFKNYWMQTTFKGFEKLKNSNDGKIKKIFFPDFQAKYFKWDIKRWLLYFHKVVLYPKNGLGGKCTWMGVPAQKLPLDLWLYQEIIFKLKPDFIIEIGSYNGGTTLYLANMMDLVGSGKVISVEIDRSRYNVKHDRIIEVTGDSGSESVLNEVENICKGKKVMVIHDGDHSKDAVLRDLNHYSKLVSIGSYFVVEDGIMDQFRAGECIGTFDGGPLEAIHEFMRDNNNFEYDKSMEKFIITYHPKGFLKKIK